MIDFTTFQIIKQKHGQYASWAVWEDGAKPKENIGDLHIFDVHEGDPLLQQLNPGIVLVGLNAASRLIQNTLGNFHDDRSVGQDYKIRYALKGTPLWGAYMTDIIKGFNENASGKTMAYLRQNKDFEKQNVDAFEAELNDLGAKHPTLIAFGGDAFRILIRNLGGKYRLCKAMHYSHYISKEKYREALALVVNSVAASRDQ